MISNSPMSNTMISTRLFTGRTQHALQRPPEFLASPKCGLRYAKTGRPFDGWQGQPVVSQKSGTASIARLLDGCRPSTILRRVVAIGIDAVQAVIRWARSHIAQECGERFQPRVTHSDPASAVAREAVVVRIVATCLRVSPRAIFLALRSAMRTRASRCDFSTPTTATDDVSANKRSARHDGFFAAFALTAPMRVVCAGVWCTFKNSQPTDGLTREVYGG